MEFQWYPGHMTKAKRQMQEDLKLIDVIVELVDARAPLSSKNPDIDRMANGKSRILLFNKYDLADDKKTDQWIAYYEKNGFYVTKINAKDGTGVKAVQDVIAKACRAKIERDRKRGILNRPVRAMVVGIPNVGKSTFINSFAKKACTKTGNRPGVTKGKQWIRLNKNVELLDTPGILWPKFENQEIGMRLAFLGSIREELFDERELSLELLSFLTEACPGAVEHYYQMEKQESCAQTLSQIAARRGCLKAGGALDLDLAARYFLDDFRAGRLGRVSLETAKQPVCDGERHV